MKNNLICKYPILENLNNENTYHDGISHALTCVHCQNTVLNFDSGMRYIRYLAQNIPGVDLNNETAALIDELLETNSTEEIADIHYFNYAIDEIARLKFYHKIQNIPTPDYLKKIISEQFSEKTGSMLEKIIVKISNGLHLVSNHMDNLILLPELDNLIATRSQKSGDNKNTALSFLQKKDKSEIIRYHIVQDGPESIMLTIKLENFEFQPISLTIRNNHQLIGSQPFSSNYAYFHKLKTGDYQFEVNFSGTGVAMVVPLCIV